MTLASPVTRSELESLSTIRVSIVARFPILDKILKVALSKSLKRVEWVEVDQMSKKNKLKEELSTH